MCFHHKVRLRKSVTQNFPGTHPLCGSKWPGDAQERWCWKGLGIKGTKPGVTWLTTASQDNKTPQQGQSWPAQPIHRASVRCSGYAAKRTPRYRLGVGEQCCGSVGTLPWNHPMSGLGHGGFWAKELMGPEEGGWVGVAGFTLVEATNANRVGLYDGILNSHSGAPVTVRTATEHETSEKALPFYALQSIYSFPKCVKSF